MISISKSMFLWHDPPNYPQASPWWNSLKHAGWTKNYNNVPTRCLSFSLTSSNLAWTSGLEPLTVPVWNLDGITNQVIKSIQVNLTGFPNFSCRLLFNIYPMKWVRIPHNNWIKYYKKIWFIKIKKKSNLKWNLMI